MGNWSGNSSARAARTTAEVVTPRNRATPAAGYPISPTEARHTLTSSGQPALADYFGYKSLIPPLRLLGTPGKIGPDRAGVLPFPLHLAR